MSFEPGSYDLAQLEADGHVLLRDVLSRREVLELEYVQDNVCVHMHMNRSASVSMDATVYAFRVSAEALWRAGVLGVAPSPGKKRVVAFSDEKHPIIYADFP